MTTDIRIKMCIEPAPEFDLNEESAVRPRQTCVRSTSQSKLATALLALGVAVILAAAALLPIGL